MKNKIITVVFLIIIIGLGFISILAKDNYLSKFERRKLAGFPKFDKDFTIHNFLFCQFWSICIALGKKISRQSLL